jgi:hypothetical protein
MKKIFILLLLPFLFIACSKEKKSVNLDKNLSGSELTETYCIKMVRDYWDCSKGAYYSYTYGSGNYYRRHFDCSSGDRGDLMNFIQGMFEAGIDESNSYYKNYILVLEANDSDGHYYLRVSF